MVNLEKWFNSLTLLLGLLEYLEVGKSGVQPHTPIDEAVSTVDDTVFMQLAEVFHYSFGQLLKIEGTP